MIYSITGKLMVKGMDMAVVECSGVGFKCFTSLTTLSRLPAIGDTVNTASRLEANAPAGTIYISRAVADALQGRIAATPLEHPPLLKGKAAGFEVLTLDAILPEGVQTP